MVVTVLVVLEVIGGPKGGQISAMNIFLIDIEVHNPDSVTIC